MRKSAKFARKHIGLAVGIGGTFTLLFMVPVVGMIFAAPLAAITATLAIHKLVDLSKNEFAVQEKIEK